MTMSTSREETGRKILKRTFGEKAVKTWTGFIWRMTQFTGEVLVSQNAENFLTGYATISSLKDSMKLTCHG
jgi:hypothetical protein